MAQVSRVIRVWGQCGVEGIVFWVRLCFLEASFDCRTNVLKPSKNNYANIPKAILS